MVRDSHRLRKRLMINLDGTGQSEYTHPAAIIDGTETSPTVSNVARIGRATLSEDPDADVEQIVYYQAGLGSSDTNSLTQKAMESLFGTGLVSNVREAYGFLCNNYDYGDEIYITGFSRGAFTARSLAGMIGKCGILTKRGLERFYEAFEYYKFPEKFQAKGKARPVSEEAGTTREFLPGTNPKQRITIRAVGVWDTVGALRGDYSFHDVALGPHVEHAFQLLALDERRGYFGPTLWESPASVRPLSQLEQCWISGDHSNVGGSWDDAQMADISLAWMMSRFEALGVKFDMGYLYREYKKFHDFVRVRGPKLDGGRDKQGPKYSADKSLNPRNWGEGRIRAMYMGVLPAAVDPIALQWGGSVIRTPLAYTRAENPSQTLLNTNETIHSLVRYRRFCPNAKTLGPQDKDPYDPKALEGWAWPKAGGGKLGAASGGQEGIYTKGGKTVGESALGRLEKVYLAFYDVDPELRKRDGSVWKKVLGGDGPPKDITDAVAGAVKDSQ